jgi:SEC-C motif-containing protein
MARKNSSIKQTEACPCGSGKHYPQCSGQYLSGQWPETAEQLMRSRYTAFTLNADEYLLETWQKETRPPTLDLSDQAKVKWVSLKVIRHTAEVNRAVVEFVARCKINGKAEKIHERSRFVREDDRWFYVDGDPL